MARQDFQIFKPRPADFKWDDNGSTIAFGLLVWRRLIFYDSTTFCMGREDKSRVNQGQDRKFSFSRIGRVLGNQLADFTGEENEARDVNSVG